MPLRRKLRKQAKLAHRRKLLAAIDMRGHHGAELAAATRGTWSATTQ